MVKHYLKISLRNLWKNKIQTAVGIGGLSIGFIIFTVAFYWMYYELNYDSFYKDSGRIYLVNSLLGKEEAWAGSPRPLQPALERILPEAEATAGVARPEISLILEQLDERKEVKALAVYGDFFGLFPQKLITGSLPRENEKEVAICESLAMQLFNSVDVIGESLLVDARYPIDAQRQPFKITGVVKDTPKNTTLPFDLILWYYPNNNDSWSNYFCSTYIKIREGADYKAVAPKIKEVETGEQRKRSFGTVPLNRAKYMARGESFWDGYNFLIIVAFTGLLLLVSALFNYIVLSITNIRARLKESALRKTMGAQIKNIFALFYSEIILSFIIVLMLSSILFVLMRGPIFGFTGIMMSGWDFYSVVILLWLICLVLSLISSIYPVKQMNRMNVHQSIIRSKNHFRKTVLTLQVIICLFLLFSLVEMTRQFYFVNNTDLGFERENLLELKIPSSAEAMIQPLTEKLNSSQYIKESLILRNRIFRSGYYSTQTELFDDSDDKILITPASPGFIEFFGLKVIHGNDLDPNNMYQAVVNEKTVKKYGIENVLGKRVEAGGAEVEIVGVINDFHTSSMKDQISPEVFTTTSMWGRSFLYYYIRYYPGKGKEARQMVTDACEDVLPGVEVELLTFDEYVSSFYKSEEVTLRIFGVIAFACLVICLLGVYAMVSLTTRQRQREIAIRKVNGADNKDIFIKLLTEYIIIVGIACIISLPPAYIFITKWLETYAYKITFGIEVVLVIVLVACLVSVTVTQKILKVSRTNPAESLNTE